MYSVPRTTQHASAFIYCLRVNLPDPRLVRGISLHGTLHYPKEPRLSTEFLFDILFLLSKLAAHTLAPIWMRHVRVGESQVGFTSKRGLPADF